MSVFTPPVVIGLITIGVCLSIYLLLRARHMINKDTIAGALTGSIPEIGDVRIIKRGDGAYIVEEFSRRNRWHPDTIFDPRSLEWFEKTDDELRALAVARAETLSGITRDLRLQRELSAKKTVIAYKSVVGK